MEQGRLEIGLVLFMFFAVVGLGYLLERFGLTGGYLVATYIAFGVYVVFAAIGLLQVTRQGSVISRQIDYEALAEAYLQNPGGDQLAYRAVGELFAAFLFASLAISATLDLVSGSPTTFYLWIIVLLSLFASAVLAALVAGIRKGLQQPRAEPGSASRSGRSHWIVSLGVTVAAIAYLHWLETWFGTTQLRLLAYGAKLAALPVLFFLLIVFSVSVFDSLLGALLQRFGIVGRMKRRFGESSRSPHVVLVAIEALFRRQGVVLMGSAFLLSSFVYSLSTIVPAEMIFGVIFLGSLAPLLVASLNAAAEKMPPRAFYEVPKFLTVVIVLLAVLHVSAFVFSYAAGRGVVWLFAMFPASIGTSVLPDYLYNFYGMSLLELPLFRQALGILAAALLSVAFCWLLAAVVKKDVVHIGLGFAVLVLTLFGKEVFLPVAERIVQIIADHSPVPILGLKAAIAVVLAGMLKWALHSMHPSVVCDNCGAADNPALARFCADCGKTLEDAPSASTAA